MSQVAEKKFTGIDRDIFRTVAYFSYFDYPLTSFEIFKWQLSPKTPHAYDRILKALTTSAWLKDHLSEHDGFWGIEKSASIVDQVQERHRRYIDATAKYKKLRRLLKYLTRVPTVEGIAVCNSLAFHNTKSASDIDLFIIVKPNRLWTTRLLCVAPMALIRQRPLEAKRHPIDTSFFASSQALNLQAYKIDKDDPYLAVWIKSLLPIYGRASLWHQFFKSNAWVNKILPQAKPKFASRELRQQPRAQLPCPVAESWAKSWQEKRLPEEIKTLQNTDSRVVVNADILKFHKNDRRAEIAAALNEMMKICESK